MSIQLHKPKYLVKFRNRQTLRWDGETPLMLGHPVRYMIEKKKDRIFVRDFSQDRGLVTAVKNFSLSQFLEQSFCELSDLNPRDTLSLKAIRDIKPVVWENLPPSTIELPKRIIYSIEDTLFKKHLQKVAAAMAVLFIAVIGSKMMDPDIKTNEELIPAKYAKLILQKPKEKKTVETTGGATASSAKVKAIAKAFTSKTVQQDMKSILRGGLSKYSVMATGRAITSLSQKISGQTTSQGTGLQDKASTLVAGSKIGNYQMGSDSGYGTGTGVNVNGQGHGQLEIGLNTADASVEEGLTKDEVAKVIHAHMNEIRYCYESAIMKDPNLAGKLLVDFSINASGIVPKAGIAEASLKDQQVTGCLLGKLKTWQFPHPRGGVVVAVSYPFIFKSLQR